MISNKEIEDLHTNFKYILNFFSFLFEIISIISYLSFEIFHMDIYFSGEFKHL